MDTMAAFAMGEINRDNPQMVFDWAKAAQIIKERKPAMAEAGLRGDWGWTGGEIWRDNAPVPDEDTYTYLASTWAIPELDIDGEVMECYIMEDKTEWYIGTYWPAEALEIVGS